MGSLVNKINALKQQERGNLIVVSGPSGAGKTTLATAAVAEVPGLAFSISYTTRRPRGGERNGVDYFFIDEAEFKRMIDNDEFLEWAVVYGNLYGTSRRQVEQALASGRDLVLDIDVQGARSVRRKAPEAILVFILPPSRELLRQRLMGRATDSPESIEKRLAAAREELLCYQEFDYLIFNRDLEEAKRELKSIIQAARCRRERREPLARDIIKSFGG